MPCGCASLSAMTVRATTWKTNFGEKWKYPTAHSKEFCNLVCLFYFCSIRIFYYWHTHLQRITWSFIAHHSPNELFLNVFTPTLLYSPVSKLALQVALHVSLKFWFLNHLFDTYITLLAYTWVIYMFCVEYPFIGLVSLIRT